jgi:hypothetical protein
MRVSTFALLAAVAALVTGTVHAQGPTDDDATPQAPPGEPTVIQFLNPYDPDAIDFQRPFTRISEITFGRLTILADGVECGTLHFQADDGVDLPPQAVVGTFVLGLPTQPDACSREGATISFVNGYPSELVTTASLERGATIRILNLAPFPPSTGDPASVGPGQLPAAGGAGLGESGDASRVAFMALGGVLAALGLGALALGVRRAR